jgi:hypothetical protein
LHAGQQRLNTQTRNMWYLLLFHGNAGFAKMPQSYVYTYIACLVCSCFCLPLTEVHVSAMRSLAPEIPRCLSLLPTSWVIYKTWQWRQCFDWQESYETICILSFMVCSVQSDQLCTVLVLLYATSQQSHSWCISPLAGRINCYVELRSECDVTLRWHFRVPTTPQDIVSSHIRHERRNFTQPAARLTSKLPC